MEKGKERKKRKKARRLHVRRRTGKVDATKLNENTYMLMLGRDGHLKPRKGSQNARSVSSDREKTKTRS